MKLKTPLLVLGLFASTGAFAAPIQWADNGHWYEYVSNQVTPQDAFALAQASVFNGMQGYLATITSGGENLFASSNVAQGALAWLGGSDDGNAVNNWTWRNGPEAGQAFTYSSWGSSEPNNCCGGENYVHTNWSGLGLWNDHGGPGNSYQVNGYIVEYSPVPLPSAAPFMLSGVAALMGLARRRKQAI